MKDDDLVFLNELDETWKVNPGINRTYQYPTAIPQRIIAAGAIKDAARSWVVGSP